MVPQVPTQSMDQLRLRLLSTVRHHEQLTDFQVMTHTHTVALYLYLYLYLY